MDPRNDDPLIHSTVDEIDAQLALLEQQVKALDKDYEVKQVKKKKVVKKDSAYKKNRRKAPKKGPAEQNRYSDLPKIEVESEAEMRRHLRVKPAIKQTFLKAFKDAPDLKVFYDAQKYEPRVVDKENLKPVVRYEPDFDDYEEHMANLPFITDLFWHTESDLYTLNLYFRIV